MDMELSLIARILWRWKWLIIACVLTAGTAVWLGLSNAVPVYRATTLLKFAAPDREDVELIDQYEFRDHRNEIVKAIDNFLVDSQHVSVYERTIATLGLAGDAAAYKAQVDRSVDSDYVEVSIEVDSALLAANIANTHAEFAVEHSGELRAQSPNTTRTNFEEQLTVAAINLRDAEDNFEAFRSENRITFLDTEVKLHENMLIQLQSEQSKLIGRDPVGQSPQINQLETRIAEHRASLEALSRLEPEYRRLETEVEELRKANQLLASKAIEAGLKEELARQAQYIQVAAPATVPISPVDNSTRLILLAIIGSLGLGVLMAFVLEYATGSPLAHEYRVAKEVRSILTDEQLIGSHSLIKQLQDRSAISAPNAFDMSSAEGRELILKEREIELQRRRAEVN